MSLTMGRVYRTHQGPNFLPAGVGQGRRIGLGLTAGANLVQQHHGLIECESSRDALISSC
jgi:nitrogen-specific signal transduction histidine kinase